MGVAKWQRKLMGNSPEERLPSSRGGDSTCLENFNDRLYPSLPFDQH